MENYQGNGGSTLDFLRYKATAEDYQKLIIFTSEISYIFDIHWHK